MSESNEAKDSGHEGGMNAAESEMKDLRVPLVGRD